jgi:hypothetical protein
MDPGLFSPAALEALTEVDRTVRLRSLESELVAALAPHGTRQEFFDRTRLLVEGLRALGHDLWSFDSDGEEFEIWSGDYTRKGGGGPLTIAFRYPQAVEVGWSASRRAG